MCCLQKFIGWYLENSNVIDKPIINDSFSWYVSQVLATIATNQRCANWLLLLGFSGRNLKQPSLIHWGALIFLEKRDAGVQVSIPLQKMKHSNWIVFPTSIGQSPDFYLCLCYSECGPETRGASASPRVLYKQEISGSSEILRWLYSHIRTWRSTCFPCPSPNTPDKPCLHSKIIRDILKALVSRTFY